MSKSVDWRQFTLTRLVGTTQHTLVTWLPERHSGQLLKVGDNISIKDYHTGDLDPSRWTVSLISKVSQSETTVKDRAHNYGRMREVTDI